MSEEKTLPVHNVLHPLQDIQIRIIKFVELDNKSNLGVDIALNIKQKYIIHIKLLQMQRK